MGQCRYSVRNCIVRKDRYSNPIAGKLIGSHITERFLDVASVAKWNVSKTIDGWQQLISCLILTQVELVVNRVAVPESTISLYTQPRTFAGFWLGGRCLLAAWGEENFENLTTKWRILKYWKMLLFAFFCLLIFHSFSRGSPDPNCPYVRTPIHPATVSNILLLSDLGPMLAETKIAVRHQLCGIENISMRASLWNQCRKAESFISNRSNL